MQRGAAGGGGTFFPWRFIEGLSELGSSRRQGPGAGTGRSVAWSVPRKESSPGGRSLEGKDESDRRGGQIIRGKIPGGAFRIE